MKKNPTVFLKHILESIEWIEKDTKDFSEETFNANIPIQDAVVRRLEIIGEAARNVPEDLKNEYNAVPWQDISDMRNELIHHYFGIDLHIVWKVVQNDLPDFKKQVEDIIRKLEKK